MNDTFLYRQIAESIRQQILRGDIKPGDRLPPMRTMMLRWHCTIGTIQRAYQELAQQGLITTRAGQGTRVIGRPSDENQVYLRRASLVHRAEAFLLEVLTAGYTPSDVEDALRQALDRWRVIERQEQGAPKKVLRFTGSHDLAVAWLATHFSEIVPGFGLKLSFSGSLGGLIALVEDTADLAGCHLWDIDTDSYNAPFVRRLLPGRSMSLITLAYRRIGLITASGNPFNLRDLTDLNQPGLRLTNRQPGSGTRVWLDANLAKLGIEPHSIQGYETEKMTHLEVAQAVAEGQANVGLGLEAVAHTYGLEFILLTRERYDLVIPKEKMENVAIQKLLTWLQGAEAKQVIAQLGGYEVEETGRLEQVG